MGDRAKDVIKLVLIVVSIIGSLLSGWLLHGQMSKATFVSRAEFDDLVAVTKESSRNVGDLATAMKVHVAVDDLRDKELREEIRREDK